LGESPAIAPKPIVIHPLHHHSIPFQVVAHIVIVRAPSAATIAVIVVVVPTIVTTAILQAIDLLLPLVRRLLRLLKFFSQFLDLAILLSIPLFLFVLLALIGDPIVETHRGGEGANQCGGQRCHDESFLGGKLAALLQMRNASDAYLEVLLLDPCCVVHPGGGSGEHARSHDLGSKGKMELSNTQWQKTDFVSRSLEEKRHGKIKSPRWRDSRLTTT
jgi:hypothetical protein